MARSLIIVIALATIPFYLHANAQPMSPDAPDRLKKQLQQMIQERNVDIQFAGKVIDQNGESVPNANVQMSLGYFGVGPSSVLVYAKTDSKGYFEFKNIGGSYLSVRDIIADGYDFQRKDQPHKRFEYWTELEEKRYVANMKDPVIFHVRERNKPTFLLRGEVSKKLGKDTTFYLDLARTRIFSGDDLRFVRNIEIKTEKEGGLYKILFKMPEEGSGLLVREQPIYMAPESGYEHKWIVQIAAGERKEISLIVKTADGIYSRLEGQITAHREIVILRINSFLNPFGEKSLELDENIEAELWVRLNNEARSSLLEGRKLENLETLIKSNRWSQSEILSSGPFEGIDLATLPVDDAKSIREASRDFMLVTKGRKPRYARFDNEAALPADGGTTFYKGRKYYLTIVKTLSSIGNLRGYIYGPDITFDTEIAPGNSNGISSLRFYTTEQLLELLENIEQE